MRRPRALAFATLVLLLPIACFVLYAGVASALMLWPTAAQPGPEPATVEAYVTSNGVHTDYVLPMRSAAADWSQLFPATQFRAAPPDAEFIAIGWGDREFYLHTPNWSDLTAARAFGALRGANRAVLHVSWLRRADLGTATYRLPLTPRQHARLVAHVRAALPAGQAVPIAGAHYGRNDAFYEANGGYHVFETCNTWTGRGLREAGVAMGRWTPFDFNVVHHLQPLAP
ncbi:MAG: TIGR02117 family protein [Variovorax sp.]